MEEAQIIASEKINQGSAWTNNEQFDLDGYYVIKDLWDVEELYHPLPSERGMLRYWGKEPDQFEHNQLEEQVNGSLSRYNHPQYRRIHSKIGEKIEKVIGRRLYTTYFYDRFYFPGQELKKHTDRDSCEISITVHVSTNLEEDWPIWVKTPNIYTDKTKNQLLTKGEERSVLLKPGDGMLYKGCERPHWRYAMPGSLESSLPTNNKELYYHQIFFHYVLQDGQRAHCAWDRG